MLFRGDSLNQKNARHQMARDKLKHVDEDVDLVNVQKLVYDKEGNKERILKCDKPYDGVPQ